MGKKVREYKSGDFIFAKVKGYPAWPARVQRMNGKKYFVYFYGTGETANLPPNMIFDYAENKEKFLTKTVKRRDFNDGVKQIEHDFANNVPLEQVIGVAAEAPAEANDSANDTANETMDETMADTTVEETLEDALQNAVNATNDSLVDDSDEAALVIDEGKKGRKTNAKTPAKETPAKAKEAKTPRGKARKDVEKDDEEEKSKPEEEIVSRSGRKIRPKRYIDEQTEENATLPSPLPKKRRGVSPAVEKEKETKDKPAEKSGKMYNAVPQSELEDMKEPFKQDDPEKDNILIAYLPSGQYVGVKLFHSRPATFKNDATRLQWDKRAAANALTLKLQLERGQITPQSIQTQLVMDLNLTDEEKAALDKERETEERKSRVQFLKTEMKLIELDAKIKTCLCLEKADTELCLKLLDELMELDVKPLMLLKHPTCLETVKRMRAYVGNTPSWDLSESAALVFGKQAHRIRKQADALYKALKELFVTPEGLSFWEFFSERVLQFKKATTKLSADELLELVHEPLEMTMPTAHTMKAAVEAANEEEPAEADGEDSSQKKKATPAKPKKNATSTPSKPALKRQSSRKQQQEEKEKESEKQKENENQKENDKQKEKEPKADSEEQVEEQKNPEDGEKPEETAQEDKTEDIPADVTEKDTEITDKEATNSKETKNKDANKKEKETKKDSNNKESKKDNAKESKKDNAKESKKETNNKDAKESKSKESKNKDNEPNESEANETEDKSPEKEVESVTEKEKSPSPSDKDKSEKKDSEESKDETAEDKDKDIAEPRAKRSRESKKTEPPPPRSPAKRKSKF